MKRTEECVLDAFDYDPETGALIRKFKGGHRRVVGKAKAHDGYTKIGFNGREYPAHRLIWWRVYGELPASFIDHINGDKSDNRLCNLRLATDAENKRNVGMRSHNTSGAKGVTWDKANKKWLAHATLNGKGHNLGRFSNIEQAAEAYRAFAQKHHGDFYKGETT